MYANVALDSRARGEVRGSQPTLLPSRENFAATSVAVCQPASSSESSWGMRNAKGEKGEDVSRILPLTRRLLRAFSLYLASAGKRSAPRSEMFSVTSSISIIISLLADYTSICRVQPMTNVKNCSRHVCRKTKNIQLKLIRSN